MAGYLAYIIPVDGGGRPDNSLPQPPVGIWPSPGHPSHPIVLPPGSVGGTPEHPIYYPPAAPEHPIVLPPDSVGGTPEHPIYYPPSVWPPGGHPSHPIAPGGSPPGYWGGVAPPYPTHPISPGGKPPGIWGGPPLYPDQGLPPGGTPIEPPSELPPPAGHTDDIVVMIYKPGQGWSGAAYDVAPDQGQPVPTPVG